MMRNTDTFVTATAVPETTPFWQAAQRDRLVLPRCGDCGRLHWYPRGICPYCLSTSIAWQDSAGRGCVYSVTIFQRDGEKTVIAYVELDEGLRLLTKILAHNPASIAIGQRVEVVFVPDTDDQQQKIPFFRPVLDKT